MRQNIMLAFVSPVNARSLNEPIRYGDIQGREYAAIQTNESAIVFVERKLEAAGESLSKIFLIASDYVKSKPVPAENEFGDVTHLEFLKRRVAKEFPQLAERFSTEDYSEEGDDPTKLERNILQIARIADAVTEFAKDAEGVTVHADMTGGFRHTSMLMLSIIQLLKYRGVKVGEILYSEPTSRMVYRVTEIQRMFTLITGADEFVKFGSVEALNEYFGSEPPPAVRTLLEAMNRFSEAIKICRTSAIEAELRNLGEHIKAFREEPAKDLKSELFAKIIDTIEREYGRLIGGEGSRAEIIRWCMRKGFWQQAMTLCTEWLPEELVERKICMPRDITVIESCTSKGRSAHKTWQQYFIIDYKVAEQGTNTRTFCAELRAALDAGDAARFSELKNFSAEYSNAEIDFGLCAGNRMTVKFFKGKYPTLAAALQALYDERKANPTYRRNFYGFLQTLNYARIPELLAKLPDERLLQIFGLNREQTVKKNPPLADNPLDKREREYRELFRQQRISLKPDAATALKILRGYHEIRHERNQINHANEHSTTKISELRRLIDDCLASLEKIPAT